MRCSIDHSDPLAIPEFLCRACHPELIRSPDELRRLEREETELRHAAEIVERRQRELITLRAKIDHMAARQPIADSVPGKILASLRRKLSNLEKQP